jgi:hypothetical protein
VPDDALGVILWTTDIRELAYFLESIAGAEIEEQHPGFATLRVGGSRLELHADETYRGHPWFEALKREGAARGIGAELRFRVEDVQQAYADALLIGARAVTPPYSDRGVMECQVMGPDGFLICLWGMAPIGWGE